MKAVGDLDGAKTLQVPLMMIVGANDLLPVQPMTELAAMLGCRPAIIPDAGHLPQIDHPDEVDAAIGQHLRAITPAA